MTAAIVILIAAASLAIGLAMGYWLPPHGHRPARDRPPSVRRILLPFTGQAISRRGTPGSVLGSDAAARDYRAAGHFAGNCR